MGTFGVVATIALYAFAYYLTRDAIGALPEKLMKGSEKALEDVLPLAMILGTLLVGAVFDASGSLAAFAITHLGSAAIYTAAALLHIGGDYSVVGGVSLALVVKGGSVLQHSMQVAQTFTAAHARGGRIVSGLGLVSVGYGAGAAMAPLAKFVIAAHLGSSPALPLVVAVFATLVGAILSSASAPKSEFAKGKVQSVSFFGLFSFVTLWILVALVRYSRMWLVGIAKDMKPQEALRGFPEPFDYTFSAVTNFLVTPLLINLHGNSPMALLRTLLFVAAVGVAVPAFAPGVIPAHATPLVGLVLTAVSNVLYLAPVAVVATTIGDTAATGRAVAFAGVISMTAYKYSAPLLKTAAALIAPHAAKAKFLPPKSDEAVVIVLAFVSAIVVTLVVRKPKHD